jgi:hypothetical protein
MEQAKRVLDRAYWRIVLSLYLPPKMSYALIAMRLRAAFITMSFPGLAVAVTTSDEDVSIFLTRFGVKTLWVLCAAIGFGGIAGALSRLKYEYAHRRRIERPRLFIAVNFFGTVVAGNLAFLVGIEMGFSVPRWIALVILSSWAGSLGIERAWLYVARKFMPLKDEPEQR